MEVDNGMGEGAAFEGSSVGGDVNRKGHVIGIDWWGFEVDDAGRRRMMG